MHPTLSLGALHILGLGICHLSSITPKPDHRIEVQVPHRSPSKDEWEEFRRRSAGLSAGVRDRTFVVTGGSGFVGKAIIERLIQEGAASIRVLDSVPGSVDHPSVRYYLGDITDKAFVSRVIRGSHCVIHACALVDPTGLSDRAMFAVNVTGTENVVAACQESETTAQLVFTSSVACISTDEPMDVDETAPYPVDRFLDVYSQTKALAEQIVLKANGVRGVLTCCVRYPYFYGPGAIMSELHYRYRWCMVFFGEQQPQTPVFLDNAVEGTFLAAIRMFETDRAHKRVCGEAFFIADDHSESIPAIVNSIARGAGLPGVRILPRIVGNTLGVLGTMYVSVCRAVPCLWKTLFFKRRPLLTTNIILHSCVQRVLRIDKARSLLGYNPPVSFDEGIRRTVRYFRKKRGLKPVDDDE